MSTSRPNDDLGALARRLRRLPPPPVPAGLEAKLLAAIPPAPRPRFPPRRRGIRALAGALAVAVMLAVAFRAARDRSAGPRTVADVRPSELTTPRRLHSDPATVPTAFEWPVALKAPVVARRLMID